jgi:hypothetical protein
MKRENAERRLGRIGCRAVSIVATIRTVARQRLRNGWLDDQMSRVAKGTIGLNRLSLSVRVRNLNNAGKGKESTAEEAQSNPQSPRAFIHPRAPKEK